MTNSNSTVISDSKIAVITISENETGYLEKLLSDNNYNFYLCNTGNYNIQLLQDLPDLILADIGVSISEIKKISGLLKQLSQDNEIPFIIISDIEDSNRIEESLLAGADDFIYTPINSLIFKTRICNHLKLQKYRKEWQKELNQLELLNKEKNEILAIAAHDLKNPIFSIQLLGKTIRDDKSLTTDELYEFSSDIVTSCDRIIEIIKQLLDLNSIESGKININIAVQNITESIFHFIELYKFKADIKNIKINFQNDSDGISRTDLTSMNNIFDNFISNAIKYSPYNREITVALNDIDNKLRIDVIDQGPGIPVEEQNKLFKRFSKISNKPTGGENSTGLGLSIVKKFSELIEAEILFKNNENGKGTTFSVILPKS